MDWSWPSFFMGMLLGVAGTVFAVFVLMVVTTGPVNDNRDEPLADEHAKHPGVG